jgi:hypothetical protein
MLSYNAVEWGNGTMRLAALSTRVINLTLAYCGLYWMLVVLGFALARRRSTAGPFMVARSFDVQRAQTTAIPMAVMASITFYLVEGASPLPLVLITPLSLLADLYVVPAAIVWWDHFRKSEPWWGVGATRLVVLLPAVVRSWRSPYRENLAPLLLIPLIAAIFAGRRPPMRKLLPAGLASFLIFTSIVGVSRRMEWDHVRAEEVENEMQRAGAFDWITGTWAESLHRFHGFDSVFASLLGA